MSVTKWQPEFERLAYDLAALQLPGETVDRLLTRLHSACQSLADEGLVDVNPVAAVHVDGAGHGTNHAESPVV